MNMFGASTRVGGAGLGISPATIYSRAGATGVVGQLSVNFPGAVFTRLSGTGFTVSSTGAVSIATAIPVGGAVKAVVRASNAALNRAVEAEITIKRRDTLTILGRPQVLSLPSISGAPRVGNALTVTPGSWSNDDGLAIAPVLANLAPPTIAGAAQVGSTLTASPGTWQ